MPKPHPGKRFHGQLAILKEFLIRDAVGDDIRAVMQRPGGIEGIGGLGAKRGVIALLDERCLVCRCPPGRKSFGDWLMR